MFIYTDDAIKCGEQHIGNTPRSIMTKGKSVTTGTQYGNFIRGNKDKLMISYRREPSHDYTMSGACGVLFENEIHFFGGSDDSLDYDSGDYDYDKDFSRQHFVIETKRSGQLIQMTKKEDLEIGFGFPSCISFEIPSKHFSWFKINVVILCFGSIHQKSCYIFDGKLTYIGDSNYSHDQGGLTKYKGNLLTVGGYKNNQKTEIMKKEENDILKWSAV